MTNYQGSKGISKGRTATLYPGEIEYIPDMTMVYIVPCAMFSSDFRRLKKYIVALVT